VRDVGPHLDVPEHRRAGEGDGPLVHRDAAAQARPVERALEGELRFEMSAHLVEVRAHVAHDEIQIDSLVTKVGDGSVQLQGRVGLRGWLPSSLQARLQVNRLPIPDERLAGATLDADVLATGERNERGLIAALHVTHGLLNIPRLESGRELFSTAPLDGVYFVGEPPPVTPSAVTRRAIPQAFRVTLNVDTLQVRGKDLDAEFGARLVLYTEKGATLISGQIDARNGTVSLFGNRYHLARTRIVWNGSQSPNPTLEMRLTHRFSDAEVTVTIRGTAQKPEIGFSSDPSIYSKAEIMSLIVTGEAADTANANDNATTNAISTIATTLVRDLTGRIAPIVPIDAVRVQRLSQAQLQAKHETQLPSQTPTGLVTRLEIDKRLTRRIRVSYVHIFGVNQDENANEAHVEFRLSPHWYLQSEYGDAGGGGLDLLWRRRY
jgi:autotransporter translocation and assembly factor TamB